MTSREIRLARRPVGEPVPEDFELATVDVVDDGDVAAARPTQSGKSGVAVIRFNWTLACHEGRSCSGFIIGCYCHAPGVCVGGMLRCFRAKHLNICDITAPGRQ